MYELHEGLDITYMATNMHGYDQLKDNPRYIELLRKMKLPMDDKQNAPTNKHN